MNYFHNSTLLARFEMVTLTSFSAMNTKHFLHLYQKMACCILVINQIFYPLWMTYKIPHRNCTTFKDYSKKVFLPFILQQFQSGCRIVYIVSDVCLENSLKESARIKRGQGVHRRVL